MIDVIVEETKQVFGFDVYNDQYLALLTESAKCNLDVHLYDIEKGQRLQSLAINHTDYHARIQLFSADKGVLLSKGTAYLVDFGKGTASPFSSDVLDIHIDKITMDFSVLKKEPFVLEMYKLGEERPQDTLKLRFDYVPHKFPVRVTGASEDFYIAGSHHLVHYNQTAQTSDFSIRIQPKAISDITLHPRRKYICFIGNNYKGCFLYDLESKKWIEEIGFFDAFNAGLNTVQFHPDGVYLATGSRSGKVMLFNFLSVSDKIFDEGLHKGEVSRIVITPAGKYLYSSGQDGRIVRVDLSRINK